MNITLYRYRIKNKMYIFKKSIINYLLEILKTKYLLYKI